MIITNTNTGARRVHANVMSAMTTLKIVRN